jgi:hypothetical protein
MNKFVAQNCKINALYISLLLFIISLIAWYAIHVQTQIKKLCCYTDWHKKAGTFEKPNKNWKNQKKKKIIDRNWTITTCLLRESNPNYQCLKITSCRWHSSTYAFFHCHYAFQKFPFFCVTLCVACSAECDRVAFGLLSLKTQVVMVQFLSIIFFFLDFFNFCWVILKFPFFCVTLYNSIIFLFVFVHELRIKQSKILWRVIKKCIVH